MVEASLSCDRKSVVTGWRHSGWADYLKYLAKLREAWGRALFVGFGIRILTGAYFTSEAIVGFDGFGFS